MGRKRRKVVRVPKKKLPKVFLCPMCSKETLKVNMNLDSGTATVTCSNCGLTQEVTIKVSFKEIDAYCQFIDDLYTR